LFDVAEGLAKGKALDLSQSTAVDGLDVKITGTSDYSDTSNSDVIIITAGVPRKPGMTRDDLLGTNLNIIKQVAEGIKDTSPNAFVICITNPLDVIVMALQKYSGLPKNKVIGMAGILDTSRFKFFISQELNVPIKEVDSFVLGGHGDTMVPVPNRTAVSGKSLMDYVNEGKITSDRLDEIIDRTRKGGAEVVKLLQTGSAFYGPAASGVEMAESYLKDQNKTLPCAAYLNGEYGINDLYVGVPVVIGANGIQKVVELDLDVEEKKHFDISIDAVKELFDAAKKLDPSLI
jgi:malate dehydrogenase